MGHQLRSKMDIDQPDLPCPKSETACVQKPVGEKTAVTGSKYQSAEDKILAAKKEDRQT